METRFTRLACSVFLAILSLATGCGNRADDSRHSARAERERPEQEREREEEEENERPDRPDLALAQELALTRDPATGTVPRERLLVAQAQLSQMLQERAGQRTTGNTLSTATWTERGPSNVGGRVRAVLPDPADITGNTVWAGSVGGGLWKSTNAASPNPTWTKIDDMFANLAVSTIAFDPQNPDFMYFGTGEGFGNGDAIRGLGIWRSTNHGLTWTHLASTSNNSVFYSVNKIAVDGNGWLYAATGNGVSRSKDHGTTWANVLLPYERVGDVDINLTTNTVYASAGLFTTGGIYRSATGDAGSFVNLCTLPGSGLPNNFGYTRIELAAAPSNPARMYALYCSTGNALQGIYRTSNGGDTWQSLPEPDDVDPGIAASDFTRGQAWYDLALAVSPVDPNTVFIGGIDLFRTTTGGNDPAAVVWQQLTHWYGGFGYQNVHADQHGIAFAPGSGTRVYFGNDGGIATTGNATGQLPVIRHINSGFNVTQFYSVAAHPNDYGYFLAGAQDNGTQQFKTATGTHTRDINGGDGAFCFIDQNEPQYQFATYVYSNIHRSSTGGTESSFPDIVFESDAGSFINPMEYDSNSNVLYFGYGYGKLSRVVNATGPIGDPTTGPLQSVITLPAGAGNITHVAVSPNVSNRVYVGTDFGQVYRIGGANGPTPTITTLYDPGNAISVSCITVEQNFSALAPDQHLLVTFSNYGTTSVLQSENSGATWASAEGNLPDMPVRWVVFDPINAQRAMLATELGVWTTDNLHAARVVWQPSNTNLANVRVDMLRVRPTDHTVVAATHGRGLFTSAVFSVSPLPVQLTRFTATPETPDAVHLIWTTASEQNSARFEVERSTDAVAFTRIGTVAAAGISTAARTYHLTDAALPDGVRTLYYRLRQVDADGTAAYSPVRVVPLPDPTQLVLQAYPNPFHGTELRLLVRAAVAGEAIITVTDPTGRLLLTRPANLVEGTNTLHFTEATLWAQGVYALRIVQGQQHETLKLSRK